MEESTWHVLQIAVSIFLPINILVIGVAARLVISRLDRFEKNLNHINDRLHDIDNRLVKLEAMHDSAFSTHGSK